MNTLTRAELLSYPGETLTEKVLSHAAELEPARRRPSARRAEFPVGPAVTPSPVKRSIIQRRVDIRRFPGRDRTERIMHYVRASFPRAENWSEDSLREIALGLLGSAEIVE